ncbi:hypothetical protein E3E14_13580 [Streptomyces sp. ICN441]|uniref:hypothetical protein n=1 Tax=Streptomyces sp. ICN441 TaxID=2558286 RepID=UPI0010697D2B|nr:hypothetical protein [Streptomyces sp. ICN441]TFE50981.1 hypothetical protein E3E14_13580 [Streptomyces sp. ICN441]
MSDIAGTPSGAGPLPVAAPETVQESYAFACMRCGYGWEQTYDIEHHIDGAGRPFFTYRVQGQLVPSPLNRLTCLNCGGQKVRIMRAGQVSGLAESLRRQHFAPPNFATAGPVPASEPEPRTPRRRHAERHGGRDGGRDEGRDGGRDGGRAAEGAVSEGAAAEGAAVEGAAAEASVPEGAPRRGLGGRLRGFHRRR